MPFGGLGSAVLGGIAGGFASSLGGSLGSAVGATAFPVKGGLSGHDAHVANVAFQREQRGWYNRDIYNHRVAGLREAGLNPILAANSVGQGTSTASTPGATADRAALSGAKAQLKMANVATAKVAAETENIKADTNLKKGQTTESASRTKLNVEQAMESLSRQANIDQDTKLKYEQTLHEVDKKYLTQQNINLMQQQVKTLQSQYKLNEAQAQKVGAELAPLLLQSDIAKSDYGRAMAYINKALPAVQTLLGGISAIGLLSKIRNLHKDFGLYSKQTGEIYK